MNTSTNAPTNTSTPQNNYSKGVEQFFHSIYQEHASQFPSVTTFLERHLFFITVTYKPGSVGATRYVRTADKARGGRIKYEVVPSIMDDEFGKLYFQIAKELVGNSLDRKRRYQPLTFAYVDFIGTRSARKLDLTNAKGPHIHAVMLVRPQHLEKFHELRKQLIKPTKDGRSIKVDAYSPTDSRLQRLISYVSKGYDKTQKSWAKHNGKWKPAENVNHDFLMQIFPKP